MNRELPIQCSDMPLWKRNDKQEPVFGMDTEPPKKRGPLLDGKTIDQQVEDRMTFEYGAERPITLCEAFIRKYLATKKTQVCMQMRRSKEEALLIQ